MSLKNFFGLFFVMIVVLSSSVFADQFVSVNTDASAITNVVCDVIQSTTDLGYAFSWFKNGNQVVLDTNQRAISASQLTKGDTWKCEAWKETGVAGTIFIGGDSVVIRNSAPSVTSFSTITINLTGFPGVPFAYDINATDADGDAILYSLSAITPAAPILISSTGVISWLNPIAGVYTFSITATDSGYGATSTTQTYRLTISGTPAGALLVSAVADPNPVVVNETVKFITSVSGGVGPYTYSWNFGDGSKSTSQSPNHVYAKTGTFTATVTVNDSSSPIKTQTATLSIKVNDEAEAEVDDVFIEAIVFEKDTVAPGDELRAFVTIDNVGHGNFEDLVLVMSIEDLNIEAQTAEFDLNNGDKKTKEVNLQLPALTQDSYIVKFMLKGDNMKIVRYKTIYNSMEVTSTSAGNAVTKSNKAELVFKPTSLPAYAAGNSEQKTNWVGVWFVIILILLLLGLAAYIVKRMAEDKKGKKGQIDLQFNDTFY